MPSLFHRATAALATFLVLAASHSSLHAQQRHWQPDTAFVQASGGERIGALDVGLGWDWRWQAALAGGTLTGRTDLHLGRWHATSSGANFTRVGITPVLRYVPRGWSGGWFIEGGIGANSISPLYRNGPRVFSTRFNFGDQLAVGRRFGPAQDQEVALRLEHLSNAEIKRPNPGENLLQLRYTRRF